MSESSAANGRTLIVAIDSRTNSDYSFQAAKSHVGAECTTWLRSPHWATNMIFGDGGKDCKEIEEHTLGIAATCVACIPMAIDQSRHEDSLAEVPLQGANRICPIRSHWKQYRRSPADF